MTIRRCPLMNLCGMVTALYKYLFLMHVIINSLTLYEAMKKPYRLSQSLKIAFYGLTSAFKEERNFRIQVLIAALVAIAAVFFGLSRIEMCILLLTIMVVLSFELINSQIEKFLDILHPDHHPRVKIIKDFSAGAVLLSAIGSVIIGLVIFLPYL